MVGEIHSVHFPTCSNQNVQFVDEGKRPVSPLFFLPRFELVFQHVLGLEEDKTEDVPFYHGVQMHLVNC